MSDEAVPSHRPPSPPTPMAATMPRAKRIAVVSLIFARQRLAIRFMPSTAKGTVMATVAM